MHSDADTDIAEARRELAWGDVIEISEEIAVIAVEIADEIGPQGPDMAAVDALVAAVGRDLGAAVVSSDSDLTHDETKRVVEIEEY